MAISKSHHLAKWTFILSKLTFGHGQLHAALLRDRNHKNIKVYKNSTMGKFCQLIKHLWGGGGKAVNKGSTE